MSDNNIQNWMDDQKPETLLEEKGGTSQLSSHAPTESTWMRGRSYMEQEAQFALFRSEVAWAKEKQIMQDKVKVLSQHVQTLESKVKDQQQNLEQRNQCNTDNEKANMNRETALLKNVTRLNTDLTEKSEEVIKLVQDLAAVKSQLSQKESRLTHEREQRDMFRAELEAQKKEWASENAKSVAETKKLRDENRELVSQVSQLQRDRSQKEMLVSCERDYLKMQLAGIQSFPKQATVQATAVKSNTELPSILKEEENLNNKITLLKDLTQKCKKIAELELYVSQLLSKNEKWEERYKSYCEKMDGEFRKQHEFWGKEKLKVDKDCSKKNDEIEELRKRIVTHQDNFAIKKEFYCEKLERKLKERQEVWAKEKLELEQVCSRNVHKMDKLQSKIESQSNEIEKKTYETEQLHEKVLKLQEDLETAQEKYWKEADSKLAEHQECLNRDKRELENDLSQKNRETERLQNHVEKQQKKILELQEKFAADRQKYRDEVDRKLNERLECVKDRNRDSERELSKKNEKIESLLSDIETLQSTVVELRETMETEKQIHREVVDCELKMTELITQEKVTLQKDCSRKSKKIKALQEKIEELRESFDTEKMAELKEQQEMWTKEKLELQNELSEMNDNVDKLHSKIHKVRLTLEDERHNHLNKEVSWKEEKVELENQFKEKTLMLERLQQYKEKQTQARQPQPVIQAVPKERLPCKKSITQLHISEGEVKDNLMAVKQKQRQTKKSKQHMKAAATAKSGSENGEWSRFAIKPKLNGQNDTDSTSEDSDSKGFSCGQILQGSMHNSVLEMPHSSKDSSPGQIGNLSNIKLRLPPKSSTSDLSSRSKKSRESVLTFSSWSDISESDVDVAPKKASTTSVNNMYTIDSPDKRKEECSNKKGKPAKGKPAKGKPAWLKRIGDIFKGFS